jgi:hypothetical protein
MEAEEIFVPGTQFIEVFDAGSCGEEFVPMPSD